MFLSGLECTSCGKAFDAKELQTICGDCVAPLAVCYDLKSIRSNCDRDRITARKNGMWRWREVLPLAQDEQPVTLAEGDTPLLPLERLGEALGIRTLLGKDEGQNPTGSFKARGLGCAVSMARVRGVTALAAPSVVTRAAR